MSNPADNAATQETDSATMSFADKVNEAVKNATVDEKGNLVLPEDVSEEVAYAATLEKRRRDTQSSYTKQSQETKALKAEKAALLNKLHSDVKIELTPEQTAELEDLKFEDPEAWRKKVNQLETAARNQRVTEIDKELEQVSTGSLEAEELAQRKQTLDNFVAGHKGFKLNDDVIANDIPPRITKKLETGVISFEAYLQECFDYLNSGKVIKQDEALNQPNLSKVGGGSSPDANAQKEDIILSYNKETY